MDPSLREDVRSTTAHIAELADGMRQASDVIADADPAASVQIQSWSDSLARYAATFQSVATEMTDAELARAVRRQDLPSVHALVMSLHEGVVDGPDLRVYKVVEALAALPGDPTIGLPPPIEKVEEPAHADA